MPTFNFSVMRETPPFLVLNTSVSERRLAIQEKLRATQEGSEERKMLYDSIMLNPLNPLLIASAISISIAKCYDFQTFLSRYMEGSIITELEASLLKLPSFDSEEELAYFLDLEDQFIEALCLFSLWHIIYIMDETQVQAELSASSDPIALLQQYWGQIEEDKLPEKWTLDIDRYDIFWYAWIVVNPFYTVINAERITSLLFQYGWDKNSQIHNAREYYVYEANKITQRLNEVLKSSMPKEEKRAALTNLKVAQLNATRLAKRGRRFYEWNPVEINAHQILDRVRRGKETDLSTVSLGTYLEILRRRKVAAENNTEPRTDKEI